MLPPLPMQTSQALAIFLQVGDFSLLGLIFLLDFVFTRLRLFFRFLHVVRQTVEPAPKGT